MTAIPRPDLPPAQPLDEDTFKAVNDAMTAVVSAQEAVRDHGFPRDDEVAALLDHAFAVLFDVEAAALPSYSPGRERLLQEAIKRQQRQ